MPKYVANAVQAVALDSPILFNASIPCRKGNVFHEDETGIFTLCGRTPNNFARYTLMFTGNIAVPTGGTAGPIAVAINLSGEPIPVSRAIYTPAAVDTYGNVTSITTIDVPKGCCFNVSVRPVSASNDITVTPVPVINVQNASLDIERIA